MGWVWRQAALKLERAVAVVQALDKVVGTYEVVEVGMKVVGALTEVEPWVQGRARASLGCKEYSCLQPLH